MLTGSRLGASFIVLFIGFVYVLRGHEKRASSTMGLLALAGRAVDQLLVHARGKAEGRQL